MTEESMAGLVLARLDALCELIPDDDRDPRRRWRFTECIKRLRPRIAGDAEELAEIAVALSCLVDAWPTKPQLSAAHAARLANEARQEGLRRLKSKACDMAAEPKYWRDTKADTVRALLPDLRVFRRTLDACGFTGLPSLNSGRTERTVSDWIRWVGRLSDTDD